MWVLVLGRAGRGRMWQDLLRKASIAATQGGSSLQPAVKIDLQGLPASPTRGTRVSV